MNETLSLCIVDAQTKTVNASLMVCSRRSRTGCLTCRVRRRKCDETKPRCRNCIGKDLKCQYGPQLTFLEKNSWTVTASSPSRKSGTEYGGITFVNEHPELSNGDDGEEKSPLSSTSTPGAQIDNKPQSDGEPARKNSSSKTKSTDNALVTDDLPSAYPQVTFNDESAARGLLALGTTSPERFFDVLDFPDTSQVETFEDSRTGDIGSWYQSNGTNASVQLQVLQLLRHYRYEIAPWVGVYELELYTCYADIARQLDILDLQQSFGIAALQTASFSNELLSAILSLSQLSHTLLYPSSPIPLPLCTDIASVLDNKEDYFNTGNKVSGTLTSAIRTVATFVSNIPQAWETPPPFETNALNALAVHSQEINMESAIYRLFLRLDLSAALVSDTTIRVPLPLDLGARPAEILHSNDVFHRIFHFSSRALFLCAMTVQWCNDNTRSFQITTVEDWAQIVNDLDDWYSNRPQEFQPMLEISLENPAIDGGFPVVLFTNGAGVLANQLYHTAMLLLTQNKPRTARHMASSPSIMSPLWHAKRICGIALNNDRRECWDLSLLASFLMAARRMTHESQHREILAGFDRIKALVGWDISSSIQQLREEWCFE